MEIIAEPTQLKIILQTYPGAKEEMAKFVKQKIEFYSKFEKQEENLLRRSEILFFGSLTFTAFGSWFFLSIFNALIYGEPFGKLRQEQFIPLFVGSSLISISIVLTDLFINIKPKLKNVEIY